MQLTCRPGLFLAALFLLYAMTGQESRAGLIINGSFELGNFANTDDDSRPDLMLLLPGQVDLPGWSVVGNAGVHWMDSRLGTASPAVSHGFRSIDLQGLNPGNLTAFSTVFATTPGQSYTLTFDAYSGLGTGGPGGNNATVSVGSLSNQLFVGGIGPSLPSSFQSLSFDFQAIDAVTTLTFQVTASNGYGPVIDNVDVTAVPEPSSVVLLGISLIVAVGARRRNWR